MKFISILPVTISALFSCRCFLKVVISILLLITPPVFATGFTNDSHDLYVNAEGDIYLKAKRELVLLHGNVVIPVLLPPVDASFYLKRDLSEPSGYLAIETFDEAEETLNLSGFTRYEGLIINGSQLIIPQVGGLASFITFLIVPGADTPPLLLSPPSSFNAVYSTDPNGLTISWNAVSNAQTYDIARSIDNGATWDEGYAVVNGVEFFDADIDLDNGAYYYRIRSCNGNSCSNWSSSPSSAQ